MLFLQKAVFVTGLEFPVRVEMEFTGERLVPDRDDLKDLYHEHISRYIMASSWIGDGRVLDLGCGCGYGSALLATRSAGDVLGVDVSPDAIKYSSTHYQLKNLRFQAMDAYGLDVEDHSFDAVVSLEMLEHLDDHKRLLDEVTRVLGPEGLFVVSTPNVEWQDHQGHKEDNPFHLKELSLEEFQNLLGSYFKNVRILKQRRFSGIHFEFSDGGDLSLDGELSGAPVPEYFLAICSNADLPDVQGRVVEIPHFENLLELTRHLELKDTEITEKDGRIETLQQEVTEKTEWGKRLDADLETERLKGVRLEIEGIHLKEELDAARATFGYRMHERLKSYVQSLKKLAKEMPGVGLALVRLIFALPVLALLLLGKAPLALLTILFSPFAFVFLCVSAFLRLARRNVSAAQKEEAVTDSMDGVSIVIPTWNARDLLEKYLPPLQKALAKAKYDWEVIVVDNGSEDGSADFIRKQFAEFQVLALEENLGFAGGVNAGAQKARYRILYTLNNDMEVAEGFLDDVLPLFADDQVFAVTSRIDFPKGKRREESGLASAKLIGGRLEVHHHFDVEDEVWPTLYAGGGSSAFDRKRFLQMGGFDSLYQPFYVEDLDLSYRAWKRGWKVLYQPASKVTHQHRGTIARHHDDKNLDRIFAVNLLAFTWRNIASRSLILRMGLMLPVRMAKAALGERGQVPLVSFLKACSRFALLLARSRGESNANVVRTDEEVLQISGSRFRFREATEPPRSRSKGQRLGVLFVSPYCPYPPSHGGAVRMYNLMKQVARHHDVYLVSMIEYEKERENEAHLRTFCKDVQFFLRTPNQQTGFVDPVSVQEFYSDEFARLIDKTLGKWGIDIIQMEYTVLAHFLPESARVKSVLTEIDLYFVSYLRAAKAAAGVAGRMLGYYEWLRMFRYEMNWCDRYDLILAMSAHDREVLSRYVPEDKITVVRNGVDLEEHKQRACAPEGEELLFVGNFRHAPNIDSILFFHEKIWPLVKRKFPRATLTVAGGNAPDTVQALDMEPDVTVAGFVPDLEPLYERASVFLAPITRGSGTRLKIVESMARGVPVVSTTLGAEGLVVTSGTDILIADDPQEFTDHIQTLLEDFDTRDRIVAAARELAERGYDWRSITAELLERYDAMVPEVES